MLENSHIALAHHWLINERGGEKVLKSIAGLFPGTSLYTLLNAPDLRHFGHWLDGLHLRTSPLSRFPQAAKRYKTYLPFFPWALRRLKVDPQIRLLISSDAALVKGLQLPTHTRHVCYCHSPPRYLWELQETYLQQSSDLGWLGRTAFRAISPYVRNFDRRAAQRVDHFIANSQFVANRINRCYGRDAVVIHPPVDLDRFTLSTDKTDTYLVVSELVPYKRIDLAVNAFNKIGKRLLIIGDGSERKHLQQAARPNISFLGRVSPETLKNAYARCRALIFPGVEDFGITPLEAQAAGSPVIAFAQGGALETIIPDQTGKFFDYQTVESLIQAIEASENASFDPMACRSQAERFSEPRFRAQLLQFLTSVTPDLINEVPDDSPTRNPMSPNNSIPIANAGELSVKSKLAESATNPAETIGQGPSRLRKDRSFHALQTRSMKGKKKSALPTNPNSARHCK